MSVRFTQSCPTCGRRIEVRASLMGCDVRCQHCDAVFVAQQDDAHQHLDHQNLTHQDVAHKGTTRRPVQTQTTADLTSDPLMDRVQQALNRAEESAAVS
jgi:hypothetical protein